MKVETLIGMVMAVVGFMTFLIVLVVTVWPALKKLTQRVDRSVVSAIVETSPGNTEPRRTDPMEGDRHERLHQRPEDLRHQGPAQAG